jgi:hypothetical protein
VRINHDACTILRRHEIRITGRNNADIYSDDGRVDEIDFLEDTIGLWNGATEVNVRRLDVKCGRNAGTNQFKNLNRPARQTTPRGPKSKLCGLRSEGNGRESGGVATPEQTSDSMRLITQGEARGVTFPNRRSAGSGEVI